MKQLDIDAVSKRYGEHLALDALSFTVPPGEIFGFVGSNGAGKTTTMRIAVGVLAADSGTVRWGGPPVNGVVRRVEPGAFTKVSALGIEEQRVRVLVDLQDVPPAWGVMGDGYRVTLRVITQSVDQAVLVPVGAVFPIADGGMAVYRVDGSRARLQVVDLGGRNGSEAWVRSGLQPGDSVVVYPPPTLEDGKRVQVRRP